MGTDAISPLRQRMIEDMSARQLSPPTQKSHIRACKRFASFLKRSPDTATADDIRRFQLHLAERGPSICHRNRTMTGLRFLFRVTLRRLDLAAEIYHIKEPQKIPLVMSPDETRRLLAVASTHKARVRPYSATAAVAVSGDRFRNAANRLQARIWSWRAQRADGIGTHGELLSEIDNTSILRARRPITDHLSIACRARPTSFPRRCYRGSDLVLWH